MGVITINYRCHNTYHDNANKTIDFLDVFIQIMVEEICIKNLSLLRAYFCKIT